jgi:hypothetical protein
MTSEQLYNELLEISDELSGTLNYDGLVIKWEFDGINHPFDVYEFQDFLDRVYENDKEKIEEVVDDLGSTDIIISEPEYDETFVFFYIEVNG